MKVFDLRHLIGNFKYNLIPMRSLLTLAFVLLSWMIASAQSSILFNHYTVEQGLSDNIVTDIVQDDNGFTWLATANGLNRFDGVQFKNFFMTGNSGGIPDNYITNIRKWKVHSLVIATTNGLGIINTQNGQCQTVLIPAKKDLLRQTNYIVTIEITSSNEIVAGTLTGVYIFNSNLQLIAKLEAGYKPEDIGKKRFLFSTGIKPFSNGDVLVSTTKGLKFYDHQKKIFFPLIENTNPFYRHLGFHLSQDSHHAFGLDRHNRFFCIDYLDPKNQIIVFDLLSGKTTISPLPFSTIKEVNYTTQFSFHNDSLLSINSVTGGFYLLSCNPSTLQVSVNTEKILPGWPANKLIMDSEKRWWACAYNGLFSQSLVKQQFKNVDITNYFDNKNPLEPVADIYHYKNKLYVGFDSQNSGIMVFDENDQLIRKIDLSSLHRGCNINWNIEKWNEDTLAIGTQSGLVLLNTNNYGFSRVNYPGWPSAANENQITINYTDRHGTRWIGLGNTNGVLAFYTKTKTWKYFSPNGKDALFRLRYPTQIAEDKQGNVWMMHGGEGMTRWNYQKQSFDTSIRRFPGITADENDFNCLASDDQGNLWIYLYNHGIIRWHPQKNEIQRYSLQNDWQSNNTQALYTGIPGQLWIIFRQSLSVMNLHTGAVKTFTKANGLPDYTATGNKFYFDSLSRNLMLGFTNSFMRFNPWEVFRTGEMKKIFITEINVLNDTIQTDPGKTIKLKYSQNDLSIHFSAIDYENGHQNVYEYRLFENENSQWINIGHQQSINLNNLPPGKYKFQVRLSSSATNNNQQIASATIIIIPPFYRTGWFYALCLIALATAFYILYRIRIRQLIQVQQVRNRISSDLHDDIGSRLTNIQILSALSEQQLERPQQASLYLRRIVNEVQTSGEALDDIVWSINSKNDSGEELAARMRRYAADIFEGDHILCSMNVNDNISAIKLTMEKRRDLYLVFKEALNNILKHSQASMVNIDLLARDNKVVMHITDNGKGFDVNQPANRNGLKNIKRRIEKWKGKVVIESAVGKGATLHIALPVNEPSLKRTMLNWLSLH
jgi:ligand-binding sensor domain-containing protein/two-component sensor histidine kinase